jgi:hypothetical protein
MAPTQFSKANTPFWWGGPFGPQVGSEPQKINFKRQTLSKEQLFLLVPTQFSMQILPFGLGVSYKNKIYPCNLALRSSFCLLAPTHTDIQTDNMCIVQVMQMAAGDIKFV